MARPRKWSDPVKLSAAVDGYFERCDKAGVVPIIEELLLELDITRNTWQLAIDGATAEERDNYNSMSDADKRRIDNKIAVSDVLKKAEQRMTAKIVRNGLEHSNLTTATIFLLKQKHYGGYTDRQEMESNGKFEISYSINGSGNAEKPHK